MDYTVTYNLLSDDGDLADNAEEIKNKTVVALKNTFSDINEAELNGAVDAVSK